MAITLMHRRSNLHRLPTKTAAFLPPPPPKTASFLSFSTSFLLLILLTICSLSVFLSTSFQICFSSRQLDSYCISGGSLSHSLRHLLPPSNLSSTKRIPATTNEITEAIKLVEQKLHTIRTWAAASNSTISCDNKGIFVYDLPSKFNHDLTAQCDKLLPWTDLCEFLVNDGIGRPIQALGPAWYRTHQYSLEPIFHSRVLNHRCRVTDPAQARLFYVPFYAGLDVLRWHFANASISDKDRLSSELIQWLQTRPEWARRSGKDHMFVLGKISWDFRRVGDGPWGSNFLSLPEMQSPYKFLIERQPWELNEIGIPHPTHFHPHSDDHIATWQAKAASSIRGKLVSFVGAARPESTESIRSVLIRQCGAAQPECWFLDCGGGGCGDPGDVMAAFMESEFCLQPPGDSPTRKSVFDGLIAGCIPVIFNPFTAYYQYPWHLPEDYRKYSVYVDEEEVREGKVDVMERLRMVEPDKRKEMRRYIIYELLPGLLYGDKGSQFRRYRDAFGIVMDSMLQRLNRS
ncbi:xyloglucan-specific galacturonosyltransferase 1-like [Phalaenopsis equestris]|uniref:xyloglucan-specific galacturonosyltransferase 1-like n=1 Tax=Phalaenopsis equestris TaxID=78828 RepID=UPI0009E4F363|nr:xyloglucan-specific galacturonosyltransferase 1-like [Phalaenopsis equestris]